MGKKTNVVDDIKAVVRRSMGLFIPPELLESVASGIEDEYVELPVDYDGVPIKVGDTVYGKSGVKWDVIGLTIGRNPYLREEENVHVVDDIGRSYSFDPIMLTHERPDSLERIAGELDAMGDDPKKCGEDALRDLAERIRKLAKEGE